MSAQMPHKSRKNNNNKHILCGYDTQEFLSKPYEVWTEKIGLLTALTLPRSQRDLARINTIGENLSKG
ncbi:4681_t:CDS:2 [Gigaspora margarita]|uniref:4681_t:CDS:1 n=1 Tax=Gigaspora margarita TaxID=4874 RepID=A0ABN7UJ00_GIGMA|nr:4681_t:CDS:2 [Gigaspora margarita]